ncbi:Uncharacterised protein [Atlantibacter hermannii]|nr:Uncharacterised protein [Atlantibacter hermannii]
MIAPGEDMTREETERVFLSGSPPCAAKGGVNVRQAALILFDSR